MPFLAGGGSAIIDILILFEGGGFICTDPGTSYSEWLGVTYLRTVVPFDLQAFSKARIVARASGNEAGAGKGLQIYNVTDGSGICEVTWDGTGVGTRVGAWTSINLILEKEITLRAKGSSATEDITAYNVHFQLKV